MLLSFFFLSHQLSLYPDLYVKVLVPARHWVPLHAAAFCAARDAEQVQNVMFSLCEVFGMYYRIIDLTAFVRAMYLTEVLIQRNAVKYESFLINTGLL